MSSNVLQLYIVTFNCGQAYVNEKILGAHLFKPYKDGQSLPDLVVLSLQEIAPIAYCFVSRSWVDPYLARVLASVDCGAPSTKYQHVATHIAGTTGIIVLAKDEIHARISWVGKADVGVGKWAMGEKGAAAIRLGYSLLGSREEIHLTFVAAHLAAHEMEFRRRNLDWENIVKGLAFSPAQNAANAKSNISSAEVDEADRLLPPTSPSSTTPSGMFTRQSLVFLAGDLNYRASDTRPEKDAHSNFPQPSMNLDDRKHYGFSLANDQLTREKRAKRTLHKLAEEPINFPPSYKYDLDYYQTADAESRGVDQEPLMWHWAKHRVPSWCDRVLFSSFLVEDATPSVNVQAYTVLPIQPTSDHRPVALAISVKLDEALKACDRHKDGTDMPFPLNPQAEALRAAARMRELPVGIVAYLGSTWEGNGILLATMVGLFSGWLMLRSILD